VGNDEVDLRVAVASIGHASVRSVQAVQEMRSDGVLHEPSPPAAIGDGL
jgi:hypothetical protein